MLKDFAFDIMEKVVETKNPILMYEHMRILNIALEEQVIIGFTRGAFSIERAREAAKSIIGSSMEIEITTDGNVVGVLPSGAITFGGQFVLSFCNNVIKLEDSGGNLLFDISVNADDLIETNRSRKANYIFEHIKIV